MIVNGAADLFRLALGASIEAADDALEFCEFLHHVGGEVSFQEFGGAGCGVGIGSRCRCDILYQSYHADGLFEIRTELGLKRDVLQIGHAIGQFLPLIDLPEKAGVVEARAEHAFVAQADQAIGIAADVHHGDETGGEFAGAVFH